MPRYAGFHCIVIGQIHIRIGWLSILISSFSIPDLMESTSYQELVDYLLHKVYPAHSITDKNFKRNFRKKALKFRIHGESTLYQVSN